MIQTLFFVLKKPMIMNVTIYYGEYDQRIYQFYDYCQIERALSPFKYTGFIELLTMWSDRYNLL